jgi:hypothetical protein
MRKLKVLLSIGALAASFSVITACGDDDDGATTTEDSGGGGTDSPFVPDDTGPGPDTSTGVDSGDSGDAGGPLTFPNYVKTLIETKTNETGQPELEAVWGALTDDEKFAYPTTFF